jgi:hypothetical protein
MKCSSVWILPVSVVFAMNSCRSTPESDVVRPPSTVSPGAEEDTAIRKVSSRTVSFEEEIKPLLGNNCVNCHNRELMPERVSFEKKSWAMEPMGGTPVIVPGHPESSRMMVAVTQPDTADRAMPPVGHRINDAQVDLLRRWIAEGADWPTGPEGVIQPMEIPRE